MVPSLLIKNKKSVMIGGLKIDTGVFPRLLRTFFYLIKGNFSLVLNKSKFLKKSANF